MCSWNTRGTGGGGGLRLFVGWRKVETVEDYRGVFTYLMLVRDYSWCEALCGRREEKKSLYSDGDKIYIKFTYISSQHTVPESTAHPLPPPLPLPPTPMSLQRTPLSKTSSALHLPFSFPQIHRPFTAPCTVLTCLARSCRRRKRAAQ